MTQNKPAKRPDAAVVPTQKPTVLLADLRELILQAREGVARAVESGLRACHEITFPTSVVAHALACCGELQLAIFG